MAEEKLLRKLKRRREAAEAAASGAETKSTILKATKKGKNKVVATSVSECG